MDETHTLIAQRKEKLDALRSKGVDPFQNKFTPGESVAQARAQYAEGREVALAGRITAHRDMGKSMFLDIKDGSGRIQIYAQKNVLGEQQFDLFRHLDLADFLGVRGTMFTTKTGEISVKLTAFVLLAKALRPPPEKWHGLADTEIRYRQRYLDLMANDEVKSVFLKRSQIIWEIRQFLHERGYIEVETPILQPIPGGAAAQPFITRHNALGCNFYLRIALELYLKRLLVGGIDRVFEIGRNFRNEGVSPRHNPEFTMLEAYQAYGDYETMMEMIEALVSTVAEKLVGTTEIEHPRPKEVEQTIFEAHLVLSLWANQSSGPEAILRTVIDQSHPAYPFLARLQNIRASVTRPSAPAAAGEAFAVLKDADRALGIGLGEPQGQTTSVRGLKRLRELYENLEALSTLRVIRLTRPWPRPRYKDLVRKAVFEATSGECEDWFALTTDEKRRVIGEYQSLEEVEVADGAGDFEISQAIFEDLVEPTLIQPTFVTHLPKELVPLAKISPDDPTTVEVFECCINGQEIAPAYSEQNDPIVQRERLEHQAGGEQQKLDEDFLTALEHGMPPAGGMGIGIDRLCMMLLGQESIRDVILFPQMKPK
jgi:lysyl-tRNA synthetase class II